MGATLKSVFFFPFHTKEFFKRKTFIEPLSAGCLASNDGNLAGESSLHSGVKV